LAVAGALVLAAAVLLGPVSTDAGVTRSASVAETLTPDTWALMLPAAWLATSLVGARPGDRLDLLALRTGDRASATAIAFDLLVVSMDERGLVVGCVAEDATAIALARASGHLLVPLLRSTR
jgi:hypothetical protein